MLEGYAVGYLNDVHLKVLSNGLVRIRGSGFSALGAVDMQLADGSVVTLLGGTFEMQTNSVFGLREFGDTGNSLLRGYGSISRLDTGDNFTLRNEGWILPGDTGTLSSNVPGIGTLTINNGNLIQTNSSAPTSGMSFEFSDTGLDQINISGGLAQITAGTNLFSLANGAPEPHRGAQYGLVKYDFIIATNITYSPQYDNLTNLLVGTYGLTYGVNFTYGVVNLGGGLQALELEFLPPRGTQILIQ